MLLLCIKTLVLCIELCVILCYLPLHAKMVVYGVLCTMCIISFDCYYIMYYWVLKTIMHSHINLFGYLIMGEAS